MVLLRSEDGISNHTGQERRTGIDREFDYRYSVLILVFGSLIRQGKLSER